MTTLAIAAHTHHREMSPVTSRVDRMKKAAALSTPKTTSRCEDDISSGTQTATA
jgi:hypothetical protein